MDAPRFDDLARSLAGSRSRRGLFRAAFAAVAAVTGSVGFARDSSAGPKCRTNDDCSGCETCDRKKRRCVKRCAKGKRCCGGACVDKKLCCKGPDDCNRCSTCVDGRCRPDRSKNGQQCSGCLACANGTCGIPENEFCDDGEICRASTGVCCPECMEGRCCGVGEACINPGMFSSNFCCDQGLNTPCGGNGDGTYRECCSNKTERCHNGRCVPKDECPNGLMTAGGVCCPSPDQLCRRLDDQEFCCPDGQVCCALHYGGEVCCDTGRCLPPGLCCADDNVATCSGKHAHCAPIGHECCGEYSCPAGWNCKC